MKKPGTREVEEMKGDDFCWRKKKNCFSSISYRRVYCLSADRKIEKKIKNSLRKRKEQKKENFTLCGFFDK